MKSLSLHYSCGNYVDRRNFFTVDFFGKMGRPFQTHQHQPVVSISIFADWPFMGAILIQLAHGLHKRTRKHKPSHRN